MTDIQEKPILEYIEALALNIAARASGEAPDLPQIPAEMIEGLKARRIPVEFTVDMVAGGATFKGSISAWDAWSMQHGPHPKPTRITVDVETISIPLDVPRVELSRRMG